MDGVDPCTGRSVLVLGAGEPQDRAIRALEHKGYEVAQFATGADALPWLDEETPCAALLIREADPALRDELAARGVPLLRMGDGIDALASLAA